MIKSRLFSQVIGVFIGLFSSLAVCAQTQTIDMPGASAKFDLKATVQSCGGQENPNLLDQCAGRAQVLLIDRVNGNVFQTIKLPNIHIADWREPANLYYQGGEENVAYSFVMRDFNLDGIVDLAIATGKKGGYGATSYNIYLFAPQKNQFVFSSTFSRLTKYPYQGLPVKVDNELKVSMRSGPTHYEQSFYTVKNTKLILSKKIIENYYEDRGELFKRTDTVEYIKGKTSKTTRVDKVIAD